jgi:hypothetical protein
VPSGGQGDDEEGKPERGHGDRYPQQPERHEPAFAALGSKKSRDAIAAQARRQLQHALTVEVKIVAEAGDFGDRRRVVTQRHVGGQGGAQATAPFLEAVEPLEIVGQDRG